ncbi:hypothetical protein B0H17DRAFT_1040593 [Mycena rosella]|uniref:Uncharacterized protein n=1 Tax=Mycena rosella TaxID=1033263 RepID=A0AAD7M6V9_MYCRO|nr:hypothetical protein B0H17DRAFT_1040593 [Mycena rosella]
MFFLNFAFATALFTFYTFASLLVFNVRRAARARRGPAGGGCHWDRGALRALHVLPRCGTRAWCCSRRRSSRASACSA